jgi:membrane protease YdiL (CAAX protease family)
MTTQQKPLLPIWARIILFIISFLLLSFLFIGVGTFVLNISVNEASDLAASSKVFMQIMQLFILLALAIVVYVFRKYIDRKSIMSLGFSIKKRGADFVMGLLIALLLIGGGSLLLIIFGVAEFSYSNLNFRTLGISFLLFIVVALNEEIMIRGYILNNLLSATNKYLALIISSVIFTAMHGFNSSLSWVAITNLFLAGLLLGSSYIFTKNLWFPISLHLFWNFLQGPVLGYHVSGNKIESVFALKLSGSELLNGGEFGFEGSLVCTILSVVVIGVITFYYLRKKPSDFAQSNELLN